MKAGSVVCLLRNERHALIPSICGMFVYRWLVSIVIIIDSGVNKLSSVVCVFALVDMRWLSLCSFGKAYNVPGAAFTGNSCQMCILLLGDMYLMMSLASSLSFLCQFHI